MNVFHKSYVIGKDYMPYSLGRLLKAIGNKTRLCFRSKESLIFER